MVTVTTVRVKEAATSFSEHHGNIAVAVKRRKVDEAFLAEVAEVACAWVGGAIVVIEQIARRDGTKRPDDAQRARFRAAKIVLVVPIADDLAFDTTRKVEVVEEGVAGIYGIAISSISISLSRVAPSGIIVQHGGFPLSNGRFRTLRRRPTEPPIQPSARP